MSQQTTVNTDLTPSERKVCDLIVLGMTSKEIAGKTGSSPRTIEDHRSNIFKKFGARNAVELVRKVYALDLRDMVG